MNTIANGPVSRCEITLDPEVIRTVPTPRRAFQGWRYLPLADAPADLGAAGFAEGAPEDLVRRLRELGAW